MDKLRRFIKKEKIPYSYLADHTGYSRVYFSKVLNGHSRPSQQFQKLLIHALSIYVHKNDEELKSILEDLSWKL